MYNPTDTDTTNDTDTTKEKNALDVTVNAANFQCKAHANTITYNIVFSNKLMLTASDRKKVDKISKDEILVKIYEKNQQEKGTIAQDFAPFTSNEKNSYKISFDSCLDGDYILSVTSPKTEETEKLINNGKWSEVGKGMEAEPHRIWHEFLCNVHLDTGVITVIDKDNEDIKVTKNKKSSDIEIKLTPIWAKSPNKTERSNSISLIVIHNTSYTKSPIPLPAHFLVDDETSAHYVIPQNGKMVKLVHESEGAIHAGGSVWKDKVGCNDFSVGIEIVNKYGENYTQPQYDSLIKLLNQIIAKYPNIKYQVFGHSEIGVKFKSKVRTISNIKEYPRRKSSDPGDFFEWTQLEDAGIGVIPASETSILNGIESIRVYGITQNSRRFIKYCEVREDLYSIGYVLPLLSSEIDILADDAIDKKNIQNSVKNERQIVRDNINAASIKEEITQLKKQLRQVNKDLNKANQEFKKARNRYNKAMKRNKDNIKEIRWVVRMFKQHFFTGKRRNLTKQDTNLDYTTAKMIKRVIKGIAIWPAKA